MLDMQEAVGIMRLVQRCERADDACVRLEACKELCRELRWLIEDEAELQGRYTELMWRIGEEP